MREEAAHLVLGRIAKRLQIEEQAVVARKHFLAPLQEGQFRCGPLDGQGRPPVRGELAFYLIQAVDRFLLFAKVGFALSVKLTQARLQRALAAFHLGGGGLLASSTTHRHARLRVPRSVALGKLETKWLSADGALRVAVNCQGLAHYFLALGLQNGRRHRSLQNGNPTLETVLSV